jgi:beta-glucanase (GH16 family)
MNYIRRLTVLFLWMFISISCGSDGDDDPIIKPPIKPEAIFPSNLDLSITIVNADDENKNGDGSGMIKCVASANDAVEYAFRFGTGSEMQSTTGEVEFQFTDKGTNTYTVYVLAYSSTGHSITKSQNITVYVAEDNFVNLIWSDEFDTDGSPDSDKWNYDIGDGCPNLCGWGNGEKQYYTSRSDNVIVENGILKIKAKKESYEGSEYTSTRMLTQGKFAFTYGKVEVRAKLPSGGGTWPAIWMLGTNISSVGWPACGEIDIMEHAGNRQGIVSSALHTPSSSGGTINHGDQTISDVSQEFYVYMLEWNKDEMIFSVDGVEHYRYNPSNKNADTWPFDADQFLILNVAMGGTFGGTIDSNFSESSMEIDYIRVYQ